MNEAGTPPDSTFLPGTFVSDRKPTDWIQHRLTGLIKLMEITRHLALESELDPILRLLTEGACQALECERASLYLYDEQSRVLHTRAVTELEIDEIRSPIDEGICGWVGHHRQLQNIPAPQADPRWNPRVDRQTGFETRNILAAPLVSPRDERLLGVLQLLNKKNGEAFDEADEHLVEAFAAHAAVSLERVELLHKYRQAQDLEASLEAARSVQSRFLPQCLPELPGYELAAWWRPAQGVSGDYYDAVPLPDGRIALVVADVSGHGLGASLIMASARAMLHVLSHTLSQPARILALLNDTISPDLHEGQFISMLLAALDPYNHRLHYANAGHGPAIHLQRRSGHLRHLRATGVPLGIPAAAPRESEEPIELEPGDLVILATDGAIELLNSQREMFGRKRFENLILAHQTAPAARLLDALTSELIRFDAGSPVDDDITLLILERKLA